LIRDKVTEANNGKLPLYGEILAGGSVSYFFLLNVVLLSLFKKIPSDCFNESTHLITDLFGPFLLLTKSYRKTTILLLVLNCCKR
jgi:hypothetical protein